MSEPHTITDDAILAAWGREPRHKTQWPSYLAGLLRRQVETDYEGEFAVPVDGAWRIGDPRCDIGALREKLGGWDAVWHTVLADEGFEPSKQYADEWELDINGVMVAVHHWAGRVGWELTLRRGGESVPLRSPADLRARVAAARVLFGEGTR